MTNLNQHTSSRTINKHELAFVICLCLFTALAILFGTTADSSSNQNQSQGNVSLMEILK